MAEELLEPPSWDEVEGLPEYKSLAPEQKAEALSNWAKSMRSYGDANGWFGDQDFQKQFTQTAQGKLKEIQGELPPITGASAGLYGDNPIAQTVGTIVDRANLGVQEFAPRAMGAADQLLSLATRAPEAITAPVDLALGTDLTARYQNFNKLGQELNRYAQFEQEKAQDIQEAGRAIGGGSEIPYLGRPGDLLQEAIPTTLQAVMDIGLSGGSGAAKSIEAPVKAGLKGAAEAVMRATTDPGVVRSAYVAGGEQALSTLNQEIQSRIQSGEDPDEAQIQSLPKAIASGLVTMMTTRFGGTTGAESVLKESGVKGVKNRIVETLKEGGYEATEETLDQAANQITGWFVDEFDPTKPKDGTWEQRLSKAVSLPELVKSGFLGGIIGSSITAVGQATEALQEHATIQQATEQATNLRANGAPQTASAIEEAAATQIAQDRRSPEERMARAQEILEESAGADEFAVETDQQFAPPAEPSAVRSEAGEQPIVVNETPVSDQQTDLLVENDPQSARARVEEALATGVTPNLEDIALAGAAVETAQPTEDAQQIPATEAPNSIQPVSAQPETGEGEAQVPQTPTEEITNATIESQPSLTEGDEGSTGSFTSDQPRSESLLEAQPGVPISETGDGTSAEAIPTSPAGHQDVGGNLTQEELSETSVPVTGGKTPGLLEEGVKYIEPPTYKAAAKKYAELLGERVSVSELQEIDNLSRIGMPPNFGARYSYDDTMLRRQIRKEIEAAIREGQIPSGPKASEYYEKNYIARRGERVQEYLNARRPVPIVDVEGLPITFPDGYVKRGALYVFEPTQNEQLTSTQSSGEAIPPESASADQPATVSEQPSVADAGTEPAQQQPVQRVQLKGTPQAFTVVEKIPQTEAEAERGEQFYRVVNERTSEEQIVEQNDIAREIKPKSERVKRAVAKLPSTQKAKAEIATTLDETPDPYQGSPLSSSEPLDIDDNLEILDDLSEMGVLEENATASTVLQKIQSSPNSPDWQKTLAKRLLSVVSPTLGVQAVYRPDSTWAALFQGSDKPILFNTARANPGVAEATLHEAAHDVTLTKLRNPQSLEGEERKAYQDLQNIFQTVSANPEFQGEYGVASAEEMVAEAFSNAGFRKKLDKIKVTPTQTLWQRIVNAVARLLFNKPAAYDSLLQRTIENAFTLAGAPLIGTRSNGTAAMAESNRWEDVIGNNNASDEAEAKAYIQMSDEVLDDTDLEAKDIKPLTAEQRQLLEPTDSFNPMGLANYWAKQFNNIRGTDHGERASEAIVGMVRAAQSYNPESGIPFFNYANGVIRNHMVNFRKNRAVRNKYVKPDRPVMEEDETETLVSTMPSQEDISIQERDKQRMQAVAADALNAVMSKASERDRSILKGYSEGKTMRTVASENGVSPEGVRKILMRYRESVEKALFLRGVDLQEVLQQPAETYATAEPTRPASPEDEQSFNPNDVGTLEANEIERTSPLPDEEIQDSEEVFAANADEGGTLAQDDAIRSEGGWIQADKSGTDSQGASDMQFFHDYARTLTVGENDARAARRVLGNGLVKEFATELEKLFGKRVVFVENLPPNATSGFFIGRNPNAIYLNISGKYPLMFLTGHEFGHSLKKQNKELYQELQDYVLANSSDWTAYKNDLVQNKGYSETQAADEFTEDFIGNNFNDQGFWYKLWKQDKPLFEKLTESAILYLRKLLGKVSSMSRDVRPYFDNWQQAQDKLIEITKRATIPTTTTLADIGNPRGPIDQGAVAPLSERGKKTRTPIQRVTEGAYRPQGIFSAAGKWSQELYNLRKGKDQSTRAALNRLQFVDKAFQKELKSTLTENGIPIPHGVINTALGNTDNRLTQEQAQQARKIKDPEARKAFVSEAKLQNLQEFKAKQADALESLPENLQKGVVEMRQLIDNLSRELIKEGDISGDLKGTIDENVGTYLHRSYAIFDGNDWAEFIQSDNPDAKKIRNRAESLFADYIRSQKAREYAAQIRASGGKITAKAALEAVKDLNIEAETATMLADYLAVADGSVVDTLRGRLPGQKNQSILKLRGDIPQEIRDLWGQHDDASLNFAKTYASIATFIENNKFLRGVLADGLDKGYLWKEGVSTGSRPSEYVEIVGGEGSKSMAPLAGTYGPPILRDAFQDFANPLVQDWMGTLTTMAMKAKTVYSIGSIVRNFVGNPGFMLANGNVFTGNLGNAAQAAWANLTKSGTKEWRERVSRMYELGVFGDNIGPSVIKELSERAKKFSNVKTPAQGLLKSVGEKLKGVREGFEGVYSGVDDFWKVYAFESEYNKLRWANPDAPQAELEQQAADIVRSTVPTYSESPQVVRDLFKGQYGKFAAPFVTFTTEVIRVTYGAAKQTATELQSDNPRIKAIGAARLAGLAVIATLPGIVEEATKGIFGYDDDDEEALRAGLPDWQKNATLLFLPKDAKGNIRFIDLSYLNPYNYFTDTVKAITRGVANGNTPTEIGKEAMLGATGQLFAPFISEQIAFGAYVDVIRNQKANGTDVYNPQDTTENIAKNVAWRMLQPFIPGTMDSAIRITKAAQGEVNPAGKQYDLLNEIMSPVLGQRISTNDRNQVFQFQVGRFNGTRNDAAKLFSETFSNQGTVRPGQVADAYNRANEARQRIYQTLRDNYLGSLALGMTSKEAIDIMKSKGAGEDAINQVISGSYWRYEPSAQSIRKVQQQFPERVQEFQQAFRSTPVKTAFQD